MLDSATVCGLEISSQDADIDERQTELEQVVRVETDHLMQRPSGHPDRRLSLLALAKALRNFWGHTQDPATLQQAMACLQEVLILTADDDVEKVETLRRLTSWSFALYQDEEDSAHLEEAIGYGTHAVELCCHDHSKRHLALQSLGQAYHMLGTHSQSCVLLDRAIQLQREALNLWSPEADGYQEIMAQLAMFLAERNDISSDFDILEEAVDLRRKVVQMCTDDVDQRIDALQYLGMSLYLLAKSGDASILDEAIDRQRKVLAICPPEHSERRLALLHLGMSLCSQACLSKDASVMKESICLHRAALELCPVGHEDRAGVLHELATTLYQAYLDFGDADALREAIECQQEVLSVYKMGHPEHPKALHDLCRSLADRIRDTTNPTDSAFLELAHYQEQVLLIYPSGHSERIKALKFLNMAYHRIYRITEEHSALENCIEHQREVLVYRPPGHPDHIKELQDVADSLCDCIKAARSTQAATEAVELCRSSLEHYPVEDPGRVDILTCLSQTYLVAVDSLDNLAFLDKAIQYQREGLDLITADVEKRLQYTINLTRSLQERWARVNDLGSLHESIGLRKWVLSACHSSDPNYAATLLSLRDVYLQIHFRTGDTQDVLVAIHYMRQATEVHTSGNPRRPEMLRQFSRLLFATIDDTGDASYIEESVESAREALKLSHNNQEERTKSLEILAQALQAHSSGTARIDSIDEAIQIQKEAVGCYLPTHAERPLALAKLANLLAIRASRLSLQDQQGRREATRYFREALRSCPVGSPVRLKLFQEIQFVILEHVGDVAVLDEAIDLMRQSISQADNALIMSQLATMLRRRSENSQAVLRLSYLEEAIKYQRQCLDTKDLGFRFFVLPELAISLFNAYKITGNRELCEEVVALQEKHLILCSPGSLDRTQALSALARAWVCLQQKGHAAGELEKAARYTEQIAVDASLAPHLKLLEIAPLVESILDVAAENDINIQNLLPFLLEICKIGVKLLPHIAYLDLDDAARLGTLFTSEGIGIHSAVTALLLNRPEEALNILDESRTAFWAQEAQDQGPLKPFQIRTEEGNNALDISATDSHPHPSADHFLLTQILTTLAASANRGPVILLIAHELICEALVILSPSGDIKRVTLSRLSVSAVKDWSQKVKASNLRYGSCPPSQSVMMKNPSVPAETPSDERKIGIGRVGEPLDVLRQLWLKIVHPIISALGLQKLNGRQRPRVHWCPTGDFTFLPLHAACAQPRVNHTSEFFVSSYTPTLAALLKARKTTHHVKLSNIQALLIAVPDAPGLSILSNVRDEVNSVARILSSPSTTTTLGAFEGTNTNVQDVLAYMPSTNILHLACHGVQDPHNPLESGFCLHDGRLTVKRLKQLNLGNALFAFLSACETAKGDENQPDQTVHLAAAMLFIGFKSIVATMWSMNDGDGPVVARTVYNELIKHLVWDDDAIPYALDLAISRLRSAGVPAHRWAAYIHMGA